MISLLWTSLRKQPTFCDVTTGFSAKWRLRNKRRNYVLMTHHYPDLGSASDWSCREKSLFQPIRSTTQIWVVMCHQYGILQSLHRRHFAGKPVGASRNFACFLSLKADEDCTSLVMAFSARVIKEVYIFQGSAINAAAFHPDGRSIALGFKKGG